MLSIYIPLAVILVVMLVFTLPTIIDDYRESKATKSQ